jgi:hypothetical protein
MPETLSIDNDLSTFEEVVTTNLNDVEQKGEDIIASSRPVGAEYLTELDPKKFNVKLGSAACIQQLGTKFDDFTIDPVLD